MQYFPFRPTIVATLIAMLPIFTATHLQAADRTRPNIIVIVSDDLGFADVGINGCNDFPTPHFDALAESGIQFTNGYVTHPYCSPSRAAILTGRYQQRFGHENNPPFAPNDETIGTPTDEVFLSQVLKAAGYRTCAIGKWHLGDAAPYLPTARGFDEFFGFSGGGFNYYGFGNPRKKGEAVVRNGTPVPKEELTYLTDDFTNEAVRFIQQNKSRPFFVYLAYNAVHAPDQAPQKYLDQAVNIEDGFRTVYAAMTIAMDDGIGRVVETLERTGLRDNTLVFFVNDNGGRIGSDNRPLRGHKGMLYEGGVRVPFLASWPGKIPAGLSYDQPVSALDVLPTAAAVAGADTSACKPLDGVDLLPYLTGKRSKPPHEILFWRVIGGQGYAVRQGRYKLVKAAAVDRVQLFDLHEDLLERFDLASEQPEVVTRLQRAYDGWNAELAEPLWSDAHPENVAKEHESVIEARWKALPPAERKARP